MKKNYLTPIRAIRKFCLECSGGSVKEVRECIIKDCLLYDFRLGRNPRRRGINQRKRDVEKNAELSREFY
jgi:hypothetical protein